MSTPAAVVASYLEAFARQDLDAVLEHLREDVYFVTSGHEMAPTRGDFSGHGGFRDWWGREVAERMRIHPVRIEALDDRHVFAELQAGVEAEQGWSSVGRALVVTVRGEKIEAVEVFVDADRAYERAHRSIALGAGDGGP